MEQQEVKTEEQLAIEQEERERLEFEQKIKAELDKVLDKTIPTFNEQGEINNNIPLREIIDPEKDIWFSPNKKKPIINEDGFKKIAKVSGAKFLGYKIIERQSDYRNFQNSQVWIEQEVQFPNGESNIEFGIANNINCSDSISKANMPIMAIKRARSRALFRSETINLPVFDESEVKSDLLSEFEKKNLEIKELRQELTFKDQEMDRLSRKLETTSTKFQKVFNLACASAMIEGKLIWKENDLSTLNRWLTEFRSLKDKTEKLEEYIVRSRIRWLNNQNQQQQDQNVQNQNNNQKG